MMRRASRGFTLIELLFAIAVVAIVVSLGVPSFQSAVRNSKLSGSVNDMIASMQVARSEAIKRRAPVVICTSGGNIGADADCDAGNTQWQDGWLVFADTNDNGSRDDGETLLRLERAMKSGIRVQVPSDQPMQDRLTYTSSGFPAIGNLDTAGILVFCHDVADDYFARVIRVPQTGRPASSTLLARPDLGVSCE